MKDEKNCAVSTTTYWSKKGVLPRDIDYNPI